MYLRMISNYFNINSMPIIPQFLSVECILWILWTAAHWREVLPKSVPRKNQEKKNQISIINISPVHDQLFRFNQNLTIRSAASLVTLDLQLYLGLVNSVNP
jgi:hypothetical protein